MLTTQAHNIFSTLYGNLLGDGSNDDDTELNLAETEEQMSKKAGRLIINGMLSGLSTLMIVHPLELIWVRYTADVTN